jgi:hypothetical protein
MKPLKTFEEMLSERISCSTIVATCGISLLRFIKPVSFQKMWKTSLVGFGHFIKNQSVKILKIQNLEN